jgi:hypothetical protein
VIPVFWVVQVSKYWVSKYRVSKYCSGGFSELWKEFGNIGNARAFKVPALSAAKPVTKSRRVIANFIPPKNTAVTPGVACAVRKEHALAS